MGAQFNDLPQSSPFSGRVRHFLYEINQVVTDLDLGASLLQIEEGMREAVPK
jgi:hypothetical protein